jgi:hypothetical protein
MQILMLQEGLERALHVSNICIQCFVFYCVTSDFYLGYKIKQFHIMFFHIELYPTKPYFKEVQVLFFMQILIGFFVSW